MKRKSPGELVFDRMQAKIKRLEAENQRLVKWNKVLTDVIEFVENRAKLLIGVLGEDGERSYTGFVKEIKNRAQKALKGE